MRDWDELVGLYRDTKQTLPTLVFRELTLHGRDVERDAKAASSHTQTLLTALHIVLCTVPGERQGSDHRWRASQTRRENEASACC